MRILVAEDDPVSALVLRKTLTSQGHELVVATTGQEAWDILRSDNAPRMGILDWMMPGLDGIEVCQRVRTLTSLRTPYLILLTARHDKEDVIAGYDGGADDYVTKPFDRNLLLSRIRVGERIIRLQDTLAARVEELEVALTQVKQLKGLVPICSYCKKIRDDQNYWNQVEEYVGRHTDAQFSHSICPACWTEVVEKEMDDPAQPANVATDKTG